MNEEERNALSILAERSEISLKSNASDNAALTLRALLGTIPGAGSILQEAVGVLIPNQRTDRVVLMLECFAQKVGYIEEDVLRLRILTEEFTDLLQDAIPQAARSLSEERRDYIASFLKNSLTGEELGHVHEKKLLSILGELNDAEIVFLRFESLRPDESEQFYEQHKFVLEPVGAAIGSPRSEHDKNALRKSFQEKLFDLGLLQRNFVKPQSGKMPEMDEKTGMLRMRHSSLTQLGRAFLRYIDQPASSDKEYDEFLVQKERLAQS